MGNAVFINYFKKLSYSDVRYSLELNTSEMPYLPGYLWGKNSGVITYFCYPQYVLAGESEYVNNLFLSILKFLVYEKLLRSAVTGY